MEVRGKTAPISLQSDSCDVPDPELSQNIDDDDTSPTLTDVTITLANNPAAVDELIQPENQDVPDTWINQETENKATAPANINVSIILVNNPVTEGEPVLPENQDVPDPGLNQSTEKEVIASTPTAVMTHNVDNSAVVKKLSETVIENDS